MAENERIFGSSHFASKRGSFKEDVKRTMLCVST